MPVIPVYLKEQTAPSAGFRAVAGSRQSVGQTAGQALDALLAQENGAIESSAILIQRFVPDAYFTQAQHDRMQELLAVGENRTAPENEELNALIDAELEATISRTTPSPP